MMLLETIGRSAAALFLVLGHLAACHWLASRLVDRSAYLARWTATLLAGLVVATLGFHALAAWQLFTLPGALAGMVTLLAAVFGPRSARSLWRDDLDADRVALRRVIRLLGRSPRLTWIGAFFVATVPVVTKPWIVPPLGWDSFVYHATKAGLWVEQGGLRFLKGSSSWATFAHLPAGGEVFTAWAMLPFHADTLAMGAEAVQFAGVLLAMVALAREIGLREPFATTSAFVFGSLPPMRLLVGSGYIEPGMCLAFIAGAVFAARYLKRGGAGNLALAAAGLGLSISFKITMAPMAVVLLAAAGVRALTTRRFEGLLSAIVLFVVLATPWYVYNVIGTGRPLTPLSMVIAGFDLGNPTPGVRVGFETLAKSFPPYIWEREWQAFWQTFLRSAPKADALSYGSLVPMLVFLVTCPLWVRRHWKLALPLVLVVLANIAYLYGREAAPLRMGWPESSSRFWLPAFAIAVPASALWCRGLPRLARVYLGVLLIIGFWNSLRYLHLHHSSYDLTSQMLLILALMVAGFVVAAAPSRRRALVGLALAVALLAGLDAYVNPRRYQAFRTSTAIHFTPRDWVHLAVAIDDPHTPRRVAVTGGPTYSESMWFAYGLFGSRLQNTLMYVPVTSDGLIYDQHTARRQPADAGAWFRRLRERRIEYVVSLSRGTIEIGWMLANPTIFEQVSEAKVTQDRGNGVWRVHFPP